MIQYLFFQQQFSNLVDKYLPFPAPGVTCECSLGSEWSDIGEPIAADWCLVANLRIWAQPHQYPLRGESNVIKEGMADMREGFSCKINDKEACDESDLFPSFSLCPHLLFFWALALILSFNDLKVPMPSSRVILWELLALEVFQAIMFWFEH